MKTKKITPIASQLRFNKSNYQQNRKFNNDNVIVAVIVKINFGDKSGVFPNEYLEQMKNGEWNRWNTPRKYVQLEGGGKKLILYDRTRKALTVEVEIQEVNQTNKYLDYPWSNIFIPNTINIYEIPIPLHHIEKIKGLENFGKGRSANRNLTMDQYGSLMEYFKKKEIYDFNDNKAFEGYQSDKLYLYTKRNRGIVEQRKELDNNTCQACKFKLEIDGKFIIECHHKIPFKDTKSRVTNIVDLVCLCPTCHRIAHIQTPPLSLDAIAQLRKL